MVAGHLPDHSLELLRVLARHLAAMLLIAEATQYGRTVQE